MISASSTPKTRASTSAGAVRCSSVLPGDVEQAAGGAGDSEQEQRRHGL